MRFRQLFLVLAVLAFFAHSASAQVFVGPNVEWNYLQYPEDGFDDSGSMITVGGNYLNPGLRLGYLLPGGVWTVATDIGIQSEHSGSYKYTNVLLQPTVGYVLLSERTTSPYLAVSAGWHHTSYPFADVSRWAAGGAVGVRRRVAAGHGVIRAELRYEHYTEKDTGGFVLPEAVFGLRVGCDLLLTR